MIIAVDGVSASGKGTLSKLLAKKLNYAYLDTGLLYRATAMKAYEKSLLEDIKKSNNKEMIGTIAASLTQKDLKDKRLLNDNIAKMASEIAQLKNVREALLQLQRDFGNNCGFFANRNAQDCKNKNPYKGSILDGRDIGTVIFPNAEVKFYVTANVAVRAQRRFNQLKDVNPNITVEEIQKSLEERDLRDKNRKEGALKKAQDAYEIDTTNATIEESLEKMYNIVVALKN